MKTLSFRLVVCVMGAMALASCAVPRGAAIQSEILKTQDDADRELQVVSVTKENLETVSRWPATGGIAAYSWIEGSRGPDTGVISAGDVIDLTIWDSGDNSLLASPEQKVVQINDLPVSASGSVFVPYLDEVVVNGLTRDQAREMIQTQMDAILPSVQVLLSVKPGRRNSVDVVGGVVKVASYPLPDRNFSVMALLSQSGGVTPTLRNPQLKLVRRDQTYGISIERLFSDPRHDVTLQGGDTVLVEDDKRYFLSLGAAGTQDIQYFDKDTIAALDAVSMIGGLVDARADPRGVLILREYSAKAMRSDGSGPDRTRVVFTLDLTTADGLFSAKRFQIQPKDLVLMTESPINSLRAVLSLFGSSIAVANQFK